MIIEKRGNTGILVSSTKNHINAVLLPDDQIILPKTEDDPQCAIHRLKQICKNYNLKILVEKTKVMALKENTLCQPRK